MCCPRLHFSNLNVLFISKNNKNLLQITFEKITCCAKREKKRGKIPVPPDIKWSVPYLLLKTSAGLLFIISSPHQE